MPVSGEIKIDDRQFQQALREYTEASKRDWSYILNKQLGNVAARASGYAPQGNKSDIAGLPGREWWPAFVQKVLKMKDGFTVTMRRKARGMERFVPWMDTATREMSFGRKTKGVKVKYRGNVGRDVKRAEAVRVSRAIIKRRMATVNSMRAVFGIAALKFGVPLGKFERKGRMFALPGQLATPSRLTAWFKIPWSSKKKPWPGGTRPDAAADVAMKKRIGTIALQRGIDFVAKDMLRWAGERMRATARKYSAR